MSVLGHHLTWLWLVLLAGATYRITRFVTADVFPLWAPVRSRITRRWPPTPGAWSEIVVCPWCMGVWVASGLFVWWLFAPYWLAPVAVILTCSAVAGALAEVVG